ncbi:FAD-binding oxidoreductase [Pseudomonas putida]
MRLIDHIQGSAHVDAAALGRGYLLACQSQALGDVRLAVPGLSGEYEGSVLRTVAGRIHAAQALNHDIRHLEIELDEPLEYSAGQYAQLSVPTHAVLAAAPRCYSFCSAPQEGPQTRVAFHVRRVPGGQFSEWLFGADRAGELVSMTAPLGDFGARTDDRPMVCIAGGSGLAPIKAMLEDLARHASAPDVTLFFGARSQRDLYCLMELSELQARWPGRGRLLFVPVLSNEPLDSGWEGLRGLCGEHIEQFCSPPQSSFYLCGPPPMIDSILAQLRGAVAEEHIHYDRFLDRSHLTH